MKIPQLQHPQTLEVVESQTRHEELMDLFLKLDDQLRETEKELDDLIQLKQSDLDTTYKDVIPTVSIAIPSILAASLTPITPPATTLPVTTESTTTGASGEKAAELVKAMEHMSIQATEMNKLKEKVAILETDYKLALLKQKEEAQKA